MNPHRCRTLPYSFLALLLTLFSLLALCAGPASAAEPGASPVRAAPNPAWLIWIPFIVPFLMAGFKAIAPNVPKIYIPFLCPIVGALAELIQTVTLTGGASGFTGWGVPLGGAAVGMREIVDQWRKASAADSPASAKTVLGFAFTMLFGLGIGGNLVVGCASLQSGADPLIVRVEQTETSAVATFDLALSVDDVNRPYWRTNAAVYHRLCEWLRDTNAPGGLQRSLAIVKSLDDMKLAYKASKTAGNSNALVTALLMVDAAASQAVEWLQSATNSGTLGKALVK